MNLLAVGGHYDWIYQKSCESVGYLADHFFTILKVLSGLPQTVNQIGQKIVNYFCSTTTNPPPQRQTLIPTNRSPVLCQTVAIDQAAARSLPPKSPSQPAVIAIPSLLQKSPSQPAAIAIPSSAVNLFQIEFNTIKDKYLTSDRSMRQTESLLHELEKLMQKCDNNRIDGFAELIFPILLDYVKELNGSGYYYYEYYKKDINNIVNWISRLNCLNEIPMISRMEITSLCHGNLFYYIPLWQVNLLLIFGTDKHRYDNALYFYSGEDCIVNNEDACLGILKNIADFGTDKTIKNQAAYAVGLLFLKKNNQKAAIQYFQLAYLSDDLTVSLQATYQLSQCLKSEGLLCQAAEKGHRQAQLEYGRTLEKSDPKRAFEFFLKATKHTDENNVRIDRNQYWNTRATYHNWSYGGNFIFKQEINYYKVIGDYAFRKVADAYLNGLGVEQNIDLAIQYFHKAASRSDIIAFEQLIEIYGIRNDWTNVLKVYNLHAYGHQMEFSGRMCNTIGNAYLLCSDSCDKYQKKAFEFYQMSTDESDRNATYNLADCYLRGTGTKKDYATAIKYFRIAAVSEDRDAMWQLGELLPEGDDKQNWLQKTQQAYQKYVTSTQHENTAELAEAQYYLGECYRHGKGIDCDPDKAFTYLRQAYDNGFIDAFGALGECYHKGTGTVQNVKQAQEYFKLGRDLGSVCAILNLAQNYHDQGDPEQRDRLFDIACQIDPWSASIWLKRASKAGSIAAQYQLGKCYLNDCGVEKNECEAFTLFSKIAAQHPRAKSGLAQCYHTGVGTEQNVPKAIQLWKEAVASSDCHAMCMLAQYYLQYDHQLHDKALELLKNASILAPTNPDLIWSLAVACHQKWLSFDEIASFPAETVESMLKEKNYPNNNPLIVVLGAEGRLSELLQSPIAPLLGKDTLKQLLLIKACDKQHANTCLHAVFSRRNLNSNQIQQLFDDLIQFFNNADDILDLFQELNAESISCLYCLKDGSLATFQVFVNFIGKLELICDDKHTEKFKERFFALLSTTYSIYCTRKRTHFSWKQKNNTLLQKLLELCRDSRASNALMSYVVDKCSKQQLEQLLPNRNANGHSALHLMADNDVTVSVVEQLMEKVDLLMLIEKAGYTHRNDNSQGNSVISKLLNKDALQLIANAFKQYDKGTFPELKNMLELEGML